MDDNTAIKVTNVSKDFVLVKDNNNSIKSKLVHIRSMRDKKKNTQHALKSLNFEIRKGEFFGILGRNGSGKSTLLKIIAEIYQPTKGKVEVSGKLVPFIELGVGFNPELTGRENVYLNGALLGFSKHEIDERYDQIVEFAELDGFMDQKLKNYSSGMQVRLAFSVATRSEADILVVDEVLAVGDADFQRKCFQYFKSLKKNKKTVVFVSHDMSAVREFCDRAILIDKSGIVAEGKGSDIANKYSQLFIERREGDDLIEGRWGDGRAKYIDVEVKNPVVTDGDKELVFTTTFVAQERIESIIAGSSLTAAAGIEYCGTNTEWQSIDLKDLKKGDIISLEWRYPNIFSDGRHIINVSLHGRAGDAVSDWWEAAASFSAVRLEKSPFVVTPPIKVNVKNIKSGKKV